MPAKGYTNAEKVALALGRELVPEEIGNYDFVAEAAEQYIDACVGRSWLGGAVTAERHTIQQGRVWLYQRPVTAVSAVRLGSTFDTLTLLTTGTDYVLDATRGLLTFRSLATSTTEVEVDYTVPSTIPADVAHAATELTKAWLMGTPASSSLYKQVAIDGESRTYRDPVDMGGVPPVVEQLLSRYRRPVLA